VVVLQCETEDFRKYFGEYKNFACLDNADETHNLRLLCILAKHLQSIALNKSVLAKVMRKL
jgi:hypothetical protein